eukprot:TRINITY_DN4288_c0_g1_i7.p1 TRINITY_DN4288_c0_g1~~TRINITY_DN4288_c0_g1_i7.p1  ORF type:complete len:596 (-),score=147.12 TRINITY_DN4288_c0_g1_i7:392-2179(-)
MVRQTNQRENLSFDFQKEIVTSPKLLYHVPDLRNKKVCLYFAERIQTQSNSDATTAKTPIKIPSFRRLETKPSSVDLDLTGSPLKADFDPNEVFDDSADHIILSRPKKKTPLYRGLKSKEARILVSRLNTTPTIQNNDTNEDLTNLVLCSYDDQNQVAKHSHLLYLGNRVEGGELVEVCKTSWKGPLSYKTLTSNSCVEEFKQMHMGATGARKAGQRPEISCAAEFYLTGEETESHIKLECAWDRSNVLLESPPPDSDTKLKICLVKGDTRFVCDDQNTEIEQLEGLISGLEGAELVWLGRHAQDAEWTMEEKIMEILEISRKNRPDEFDKLQEPASDNLLNVNERQDVDITDMLWKILCQCESYAELTDSLHFLFNTILTEDIRPFLYSGNQSSMAGLLRATLRTASMPDLSGAKPLSLLLEMGIEKLKRDSSHFLLSSDLASKESLDHYLSGGSSLSESLTNIKRLHLVVETAFACQTYVSLPTASVKTIVHAALARLRDAPLEERMNMEFNIQAADVKAELETGRATLWSMTYKNDFVTSTAILQMERPEEIYPHPVESVLRRRSTDNSEPESVEESEPDYYIIYHTSIKQD